MKIAIYSGTKNVYKNMIPSMKSLLLYSDVDKIYFLIEDDIFPYELPPQVQCINVSDQQYFVNTGPNMNSKWTYMILLRGVYAKLFPQLDKVLCLDYDVIFTDNISDLWDIPLGDNYFGAIKQPKKSTEEQNYINTGVLLMNLQKIREDHIDDILLDALNNYKYFFPEQDCINEYFNNKIYLLNPKYNVSKVTDFTGEQKAFHYCQCNTWMNLPLVQYYLNLDYTTIRRNSKHDYKLDIIIPFTNENKLIKTLKSINNNLPITITCVHYLPVNEDLIYNQFPQVNILQASNKNLYQYGLQNTNNEYVLFINENHYFLSKQILKEVYNFIVQNNFYYIYSFLNYNLKNKKNYNESVIGNIYNRFFLKLYHINFLDSMNEQNELIFARSSLCVINQLKLIEEKERHKIYLKTLLSNTELNNNNNNDTFKNLIFSTQQVYINNKINKINIKIIIKELTYSLNRLQTYYKNNDQLTKDNKKLLQQLYNIAYKPYIKIFKQVLIMNNESYIIIENIMKQLKILESI